MTSEDKFLAALDVIRSIPYDGTFEPSEEMMIKLYAYQMQAIEGECTISKPYIWNVSGRNRWLAWKSLGKMPKEVAMDSYVHELTKVIETMAYNDKISKFMSLIGPFYEIVSEESVLHNDLITERVQNVEDRSEKFSVVECIDNDWLEKYDVQQHDNLKSNRLIASINVTMNESLNNSLNESRLYSSVTSSSSCDSSNFDLLSDISDSCSSENIETEKTLQTCKTYENAVLPDEDLLVLMTRNLKNSLESIVHQFDEVNSLALNTEPISAVKNVENSEWNFNFSAVAFTLLWPIALELCFAPYD